MGKKMMDSSRKIKIVVISGKQRLFYANFQLIDNLSMVEIDSVLYTVLKDNKGFYIPSSGSSRNRYIESMVQHGESVYFVS